ncbi:MAG: putative Two component signal transduction response regulator [Candidatus Eremiobacteraeota bacterium]|nr:putative Two component signal transduction response regulator [Candidatus Eremiobacteraeota bacterium]
MRAVLVAADVAETSLWTEAAHHDLSLDASYAGTLAEALALVEARNFDIAVVSSGVCDGSYRDLLRALQTAREDLPVIVVAALDHDAVRDALALGAIDIIASSDLVRLGPAVSRALRDGVLAALLRRTRAETTLLDETLRRTRDDVVIVAIDDAAIATVYATRPDLVGRPLAELPFVRDGEEAEELAACVYALRPARLTLGSGTVSVEPLAAPPYDRRYVAITLERGGVLGLDERDPVTGLPQRAAFERMAQSTLAEAERDGTSAVVLFLDVDRFHVVNEIADHTAGDTVLREIATRLRDALPDAYVARFGGDEFVLLRLEDTPEAAAQTVNAALAAFSEPFTVALKPVYLTASIGVAQAPDDATDVAALIGTAEAAVFEAKRLGRNTVRWYRSPGASSSLERVLTRRDLQGAIQRNEFELYYQPMYDIETRAIHGVEALLRWRHPVHGLMLPDRFIPVAEEFGLIEEIGAWVLDEALAQVRKWADIGIPAIRVSVNVSARQFENDALPKLVAVLLDKHQVAATCLEIEITESSIMRDVPAAVRLLRALRELGVRVSIDDFGTGYTSLSFLKRFPVDQLKIDRTFVADVAGGAFDGAIVRAVTTLARGLGVRTVAEGVEEQEQLDRLRTLDCDVVQGFLLCHPLPAAACTPVLAAMAPAV